MPDRRLARVLRRTGIGVNPRGDGPSAARGRSDRAAGTTLGDMRRVAERIRRLRGLASEHPQVTDAAVTALILALTLSNALITNQFLDPPEQRAPWEIALLSALMVVPLAWRRRVPFTVLAATTLAFCLFRWREIPEPTFSSLAIFLAIYSAGAHAPPGRARDVWRGASLVANGALLAWSLLSLTHEAEELPVGLLVLQLYSIVFNLAFFVTAWVLGDLVRTRTARERLLAQRTEELVAEREANARRAVMEERLRIARELHDVIAHHVSVMGIQAAGARRVLQRRPEDAAAALESVEASSREAVSELHRLLGFLRSDGEAEDREPQPGLGDLDRLVDQVRQAGLPVEVAVRGEPRPLPPGLEVSAYRIVQEALTNTLRHAGHAHAQVTVTYEPDALELAIRDDGVGPRQPVGVAAGTGNGHPVPGTGQGLVGMRERVTLHGGALEVGPNPGGGFLVRARLPLASGARA